MSPIRLLAVFLAWTALACGSERSDMSEREDAWSSSLDAESNGSDESGDAGSETDTGGEVSWVCVYTVSKRMACSGYSQLTPEKWECASYIHDLDTCRSERSHYTDCDGSCCFEYNYWHHQIVEGPCDAALRAVDGSGDDAGGSSGGSASCPSEASCVAACLRDGYQAYGGACTDDGACLCEAAGCGECVEACLDAGYAGFSGVCEPGQGCWCTNVCEGCQQLCIDAGYRGFSGTCTDEACFCE